MGHSFAMAEAKNTYLSNANTKKKEFDPLISVKDKLSSMTLNNLMPQSLTQITPQASQRGTPRKLSSMSNQSYDQDAPSLILSDHESPLSPPLIFVENFNRNNGKLPPRMTMMKSAKSYDHINSFHDISSSLMTLNPSKQQRSARMLTKNPATKRRSFINHRHQQKMPYVEDDDSSDVSVNNLKRVSMKYTKSAHSLFSKSSSPKVTSSKNEIPSFFQKSQKGRNYSKSFSVHKSRKHRSGSIHTKSSYPSGKRILKDRTKTNSQPRSLLNPTMQSDAKYKNKAKKKKSASQKRRSVNLRTMHKALKMRTNKNKRESVSKSPTFGPNA